MACNKTYIHQHLDQTMQNEDVLMAVDRLLCKSSSIVAFRKMMNHTLVMEISASVCNYDSMSHKVCVLHLLLGKILEKLEILYSQ